VLGAPPVNDMKHIEMLKAVLYALLYKCSTVARNNTSSTPHEGEITFQMLTPSPNAAGLQHGAGGDQVAPRTREGQDGLPALRCCGVGRQRLYDYARRRGNIASASRCESEMPLHVYPQRRAPQRRVRVS